MGYDYQKEKQNLFTEQGQIAFLHVRDGVHAALKQAGAIRYQELNQFVKGGMTGDSWFHLACVDRLVELGEIVRLREPDACWAQYQVFASPQVNNY